MTNFEASVREHSKALPPTRRYFIDTEFHESKGSIKLISIGIVCDDGRELYLQNVEYFHNRLGLSTDWLVRNVFPSLAHFDMAKQDRTCTEVSATSRTCSKGGVDACPWRHEDQIGKEIVAFVARGGARPEFWGYYADYDWVVLCWLFGSMVNFPKGWPMYCNDLKQLAVSLGDPELPAQGKGEHNALADARWNKEAYGFLMELQARAFAERIRMAEGS